MLDPDRIRILVSDPDHKLDKTSFLPSLIFKHKNAAFPQLRDLATNKVGGTDVRIRNRTKMSQINNTTYNY
jgi:hypothetical protein